MTRPAHRPWTTRFALWAAVCALLLKAAVPMLATASAELQGKTLVEVCTVYGVATVALDTAGDAPAPADHDSAHAADHCVLGGLLTVAAPSPQTTAWPGGVPQGRAPPGQALAAPLPVDATARWAALRKHGPPASA